jgi:hypothetical protein
MSDGRVPKADQLELYTDLIGWQDRPGLDEAGVALSNGRVVKVYEHFPDRATALRRMRVDYPDLPVVQREDRERN